jgi:hypothetical protein
MLQARDHLPQRLVYAAPAELRALTLRRQTEQPQRRERVHLQRLPPPGSQRRRESVAAPRQHLYQRGGEDRYPHPEELPLDLSAAGAGVVATGAVVVEAAPPAGEGERGVDRHDRARARERDGGEDLGVVANRGQDLEAAVAQQRDAGLAPLHARQIDADTRARPLNGRIRGVRSEWSQHGGSN